MVVRMLVKMPISPLAAEWGFRAVSGRQQQGPKYLSVH